MRDLGDTTAYLRRGIREILCLALFFFTFLAGEYFFDVRVAEFVPANEVVIYESIVVGASVIGYFALILMKELRLVGGYDILYGKVKEFISRHLFDETIELDAPNTVRNLCELEACKMVIETFKKKINELTVQDKGVAAVRDHTRLKETRPFVVKDQAYLIPQKSVFNKTCASFVLLGFQIYRSFFNF